MRVLLDTNVVLDVLLKREPWQVNASAIWNANIEGRITVLISADALTTIFFIMRKQRGGVQARDAVAIRLRDLEERLSILTPAALLAGFPPRPLDPDPTS